MPLTVVQPASLFIHQGNQFSANKDDSIGAYFGWKRVPLLGKCDACSIPVGIPIFYLVGLLNLLYSNCIELIKLHEHILSIKYFQYFITKSWKSIIFALNIYNILTAGYVAYNKMYFQSYSSRVSAKQLFFHGNQSTLRYRMSQHSSYLSFRFIKSARNKLTGTFKTYIAVTLPCQIIFV